MCLSVNALRTIRVVITSGPQDFVALVSFERLDRIQRFHFDGDLFVRLQIPSCRGKTIVIWSELLLLPDLWILGRKHLSRCGLRCWTRTFLPARRPTSSPCDSARHLRRTILASSSPWAATVTRNYDVSFVRTNLRVRTIVVRVNSKWNRTPRVWSAPEFGLFMTTPTIWMVVEKRVKSHGCRQSAEFCLKLSEISYKIDLVSY